MFLLFVAILSCALGAPSTEIGMRNFRELGSGCWVVRFAATWCGACRQSQAQWDEMPSQIGDCKVGVVNVDGNRALTEAFGVDRIPSFFFVSSGGNVVKYDTPQSFKADELTQWVKEQSPAAPGGWMSPVGPLYTVLIFLGYGVELFMDTVKTKAGLNDWQAQGALLVTVFVLMSLWGLFIWKLLLCIAPLEGKGGAAKKKTKAKKE